MMALLDLSKMCRVCRDDSDCLLDLYVDKEQEPTLAEMLSKCSGCRVDRADGFPPFVCAECAMATRAAFRLRQQCRKSMQYFSQLLGMVTEPDGEEELDSGDLRPSQEQSNALRLTETEGEESHDDESNFELYVELVASEVVLESPKKGNNQLHDINRSSESMDSSSDEKNASPMKKLRSNSKSSSDDSWSPSLSKKTTKKPRTLRDRSYSEGSNDDSSKKPKNIVKKFPCSQCTRSFDQKGNLITHIRVHTGERPFRCTYCSQTFKQRAHLDNHVRRHTGEKPFKCSHCSYSCHQNASLRSHIKALHKGY